MELSTIKTTAIVCGWEVVHNKGQTMEMLKIGDKDKYYYKWVLTYQSSTQAIELQDYTKLTNQTQYFKTLTEVEKYLFPQL